MVPDVAFWKMSTEASATPSLEKASRMVGSGELLRQRQDSNQKLSVLQEMQALQARLEADIQHQETKIYEMEGDYLAATADVGNMIKGWEGYLSSGTKARRPPGKLSTPSGAQDRLFSLTSCTSQVWREFGPWTDEDPASMGVGTGNAKPWQSAGVPPVAPASRQSSCSSTGRPPKRNQNKGNSTSHFFKASGSKGGTPADLVRSGVSRDPDDRSAEGSSVAGGSHTKGGGTVF
ncbi:histone acetyltransferase subunit nua4 protein [Cystoisospora suis]|uniref:Histone acetyltransferase subunit nua4 protein n=1 Tax=Cystoisospora suis TaxID=483139 RepID=A0A2C6L8V4_9APIC|nr:histone acetyltransferase subunit nua4 protein [Cystoisospora suis]